MGRTTQPDDRPNLTPQAVAERLGVSRPVAERLMTGGEIRCVNIARDPAGAKFLRTSEVWLNAFLAGQTTAPEAR